MKQYVLVIDEGTTGTRALIFNQEFSVIAQSYEEFTQFTPSEDKVEHDAMEIYDKTVQQCRNAISQAGISPNEIACIGITNQRATAVIWDKETGIPLYHAIVWQDSRTGARCEELNNSPWGMKCKMATGWTIATVYSSLMIEWMMQNVPQVREKLLDGSAIFGTIDSWLIWKLTGGKTHAISYSNASVTGALDLKSCTWYQELLDYLGIPVACFPSIMDDSGNFGTTLSEILGAEIPIMSAIADQHAALYAQGCRGAGMAKLTNGTGSFLDVNIGEQCAVIPEGGINTVIGWKIGEHISYAMEGYAAVTGSAVQWLRDGLGIIEKSADSETLARSVEDSNGLYLVPALTGLGTPHWDPFARGLMIGINRGTTKAHVCRATLESIAFSIKDIIESIKENSGQGVTDIRIDGGASKNNLLAQLLADILDATIRRPNSVEATSLGAAELAGLAAGIWREEDFDRAVTYDATFTSHMEDTTRAKRYSEWLEAVERSRKWIKQ